MDRPHKFISLDKQAHPRICLLCGREVNDYQYHFAEETNVTWSAPSPSEQERAERIAHAELIEWIFAHSKDLRDVAFRIETAEAERDKWKLEAIRLRGIIANASAIIGGE